MERKSSCCLFMKPCPTAIGRLPLFFNAISRREGPRCAAARHRAGAAHTTLLVVTPPANAGGADHAIINTAAQTSSSQHVRPAYQPPPAVLFCQNEPAISNQPAVLFSQNKSAPTISHQPNEQADRGTVLNIH
jgi:hypothetical protein